jgi:uncharacterized membrane protein (DUF2068 family)
LRAGDTNNPDAGSRKREAGIEEKADRTEAAVIKDGVRLIAVFEAAKGALVLIVGFGLLRLVHHDTQAAAEALVRHMHLNPARHYPRIFIEAAAHASDSRLKGLAAFAFLYSAVRGVEAYGLWRLRTWAEWFAIVSGSIYVPARSTSSGGTRRR